MRVYDYSKKKGLADVLFKYRKKFQSNLYGSIC